MILLKLSSDDLSIRHPKMLSFAAQLKAGKGLTLVSACIRGDIHSLGK